MTIQVTFVCMGNICRSPMAEGVFRHMVEQAGLSDQIAVDSCAKGMDTFRVLDNTTVAYLDLTGSGNETAAHIGENGRMTIMFCSFAENPLILRLYGHGEVITPNHTQWQSHVKAFNPMPGMRQIIAMHIDSLQTSCGYAVPLYNYEGERDTLARWAEKKGEDGIRQYWQERNQNSIDGLPTHLLDKDP